MTTVNVQVTRKFRGTKDKTASTPVYFFPSKVQSGNGLTMEQLQAALSNRKPLHGFERRVNNVLAFDDGTTTFSISGTQFGIWYSGVQTYKDTETLVINVVSNVPSVWCIFYDRELTLTADSFWDIFEDLPICVLYWNGETGELEDHRHPVYKEFDIATPKRIPLRIPVESTAMPTISNYQAIYAAVYGENPDIRLMCEYEDTGMMYERMQRPFFTYDSLGLLDTIFIDCGDIISGYFLIK